MTYGVKLTKCKARFIYFTQNSGYYLLFVLQPIPLQTLSSFFGYPH